jgi:hypothetical protein
MILSVDPDYCLLEGGGAVLPLCKVWAGRKAVKMHYRDEGMGDAYSYIQGPLLALNVLQSIVNLICKDVSGADHSPGRREVEIL